MGLLNLPDFSAEEIKAIAHYQKRTLVWFGLRFIATCALAVVFSLIYGKANPSEPSAANQTMTYIAMAVQWLFSGVVLYYLFHLAKTLRLFPHVLVCWAATLISFFIGLLGVIFILTAIIQANRALRAKGIRIGLIGADPASLADYLNRAESAAPLPL